MERTGVLAAETAPDRRTGEEPPVEEPEKKAAANDTDPTKYNRWSVADGESTIRYDQQKQVPAPYRQPTLPALMTVSPAPPGTQSPSVTLTRRDDYILPTVPPGPPGSSPAPTGQEEAVGSGYAAGYYDETPWVSANAPTNVAKYNSGLVQPLQLHIQQQQQQLQQQQQQQFQLQLQQQRQSQGYAAPLWSPTYNAAPVAFAGPPAAFAGLPPGFEDPRFYNLIPPGLPCAIITERVEDSENTAYVVARGLDDVWNKTLDGLIVGMRALKNVIWANTVLPGTNEVDDLGVAVRAMDASQAIAGVLRLHANYAMSFRSIPLSNPTFDDNPALVGARRCLAVKEYNTYKRERQKVRQLI